MKTPVVIIGGGPCGSACAMNLAARGIDSVIVEQETFPRFHIGESLTGGSADLLRELGLEQAMIDAGYPTKYGIRIFGPTGRINWWVPIRTRRPDGQHDTISWQVRRSQFDKFLLDTAVERGATLVSGKVTQPLLDADGAARGVRVQRADGSTLDVDSEVVIDASGQKTFLCKAGLTGVKARGRYSRQVAIYSHFADVERDEGDAWGNTLTFFQQRHHWSWFIPLDEQVTSIGFVVPGETFQAAGQSPEEFLTDQLTRFHPELSRRTRAAARVEEVRATSNYSYDIANFTGRGWLCVGDAHRFVDPLFSYGVNIALQEAREAAVEVQRYLAGETTDPDRPFAAFEAFAARGVSTAQIVLDGFWDVTFTFGFLLREHQEDFVDLFSGRVWVEQEYPAVAAMRESLDKHYLDHPELAPDAEPVATA